MIRPNKNNINKPTRIRKINLARSKKLTKRKKKFIVLQKSNWFHKRNFINIIDEWPYEVKINYEQLKDYNKIILLALYKGYIKKANIIKTLSYFKKLKNYKNNKLYFLYKKRIKLFNKNNNYLREFDLRWMDYKAWKTKELWYWKLNTERRKFKIARPRWYATKRRGINSYTRIIFTNKRRHMINWKTENLYKAWVAKIKQRKKIARIKAIQNIPLTRKEQLKLKFDNQSSRGYRLILPIYNDINRKQISEYDRNENEVCAIFNKKILKKVKQFRNSIKKDKDEKNTK